MKDDGSEDAHGAETFDDIADGLRRLREDAGAISYAEISRRIAERRMLEGVPEAAARPARTTVYDAFAKGRSRVSPELVREIVLALHSSEDEAREWEERCRRARKTLPPAADPDPEAEPHEAVPARAMVAPRRLRPRHLAALLGICLLLNVTGNALVAWFRLPLYLDMIGTAIVAMLAGPWWGVLVAVATNLSAAAVNSPATIPFVLVNIAGALVWGFGARYVRTLAQFFLLNVAAAVACTAVAVPLLLTLFGGATAHSADSMAANFTGVGGSAVLGLLSANLFTSVVDKVLSGFLALTAIGALSRRLAVASRLALEGGSDGPRQTLAREPVRR